MLLKRLVLQGYKTFATRTEFVFGDGVTAIVGPNGSGKSNIADAVRWVLGEQSYRTLRGRQTTDMIFAGSRGRARSGMAQAILTLDNSGNWLPIDYAEVEIGRRAYRSGENEYLLNGQKVRLRDIQELLATSGLAERTYTMIGQGLIDQALSLKADERRALFEEAAGISHYKSRRAETMRRLQETQRNLQRVHDILAEIRPRLNSLRRQASRARNYEQVYADLRHLLRLWYGYQWDQSRVRVRALRADQRAAEKEWQSARREQLALQEKIGEQRRDVNRVEAQITAREDDREKLRVSREQARRQVAVLRERRQLLQRQVADGLADLPRLEGQRAAAQKDLDEAMGELETARADLSQAQQALTAFNEGFAAQQDAIDHWRQRVDLLEKDVRRRQDRVAQASGETTQLEERLRERRVQQPDGGAATDLDAALKAAEAALGAAETALSVTHAAREAARRETQAAELALRGSEEAQREAERAFNKLGQHMARLESRVDLLDQLRQSELILDGVRLTGRLAALLTIPDDLQQPLEAALQARLGTLLVPDAADLWRLLEKNESVVAAAVHDLSNVRLPDAPEHPALLGRAADLVTATAAAGPLVRLLLGPIFVVADDAAAYEIGRALPLGALAVSVSGLLVHGGGVVERRSTGDQSILAREAAWREARSALEVEQTRARTAETALAEQQAHGAGARAALAAAQEAASEAVRREQAAQQARADAQRGLDRIRQQLQFQERQLAAQEAEIGRLTERLAALRDARAAEEQALGESEEVLAAAREQLAALPLAEAQQQRQTLQQQIEAARTILAGRQAVVDSRRTTLTQISTQASRLQTRLDDLRAQQENLNLEASEEQLNRVEKELSELEMNLEPLQKRLREARNRIVGLEEELERAQKQTHELETDYTQSSVRLSQHENHIEGLRERIRADLGLVSLNYDDNEPSQSPLPIQEVVEQLPDVESLPEDIERNIQEYRSQLQRMGGINPDAPAEYDETQTRHDFLVQQVDDLEQTEIKLRRVIAELDDLTSRAFAETVHRVNDVFGTTFTQLFGGGTAQLVLTDPDDLTISGVDILAQLPRRREQGLGLLSGGERSLTAAALVFSLLRVSPTPFCVMDEVDAMLDEANVTRFRELLVSLSKQTQFIVITHNRGTVQAAQTVYGISMGGDSASQVISIKPEEYINAREML